MKVPPRLLGAALLCGALLAPGEVFAFCQTMACSGDDPALACTRDENGCLVNSRPLFWPTSCLSYGVQQDGSQSDGISYEAMHGVVTEAFRTWISVDCGGTTPAISIQDSGAIECDKREYNPSQANSNVFMFRDQSWPYENQEDTLALTTITFNVKTGEIYDADVEVNSYDYELTVGDDAISADLLSIIMHEAGHFLGLSHSQVRSATMRPGYHPGDVGLRTLDADDAAGICALYGAEAAQRPAQCEPRHGFSRQCAVAETGCCAIGGTRPSGKAPLLLFALGGALVLVRRRLGQRRQGAGA